MFKKLRKAFQKTDTIYYNNPLRDRHAGRYIQDTTQDIAHYIHKAHIIMARAFKFYDPWDREIVSFYQPFQWANIHKVAEAITSDPILLINPNELDDENPIAKKQLQNKWMKNQGMLLLKKAIEKGRKHGWVLYVPVQAKYLPAYYSGPPWHLYSADECKAIDWDIYGHPITWHVNPTNKKIDAFDISVPQCYFFDVYQTDDFDGFPEGSQIWDDLIDYVFIKEAMKSFDQRMGNGFLILPVPLGTPSDVKSAYEQKIMNVRTEMGLIWEVDSDQDAMNQKPEWMTPQGAVDFVAHLDKFEDGIATGMGFPKRWLRGDSEGAMESSGKDKLQVHSKLTAVFNQWKRFVIGVCIHHGWISDYTSIEVRAGFKMELSDEEKANIDEVKTRTIAAKVWLSINEQRELDGYPPKDEAGADEVMINDNDPDQNKPDQGGQPDSAGKNDVDPIDLLTDIFTNNSISIRDLASIMNVSPTTVSKIRDKFDADRQPKQKIDDLDLKLDSVQLHGDVWEYTGTVLKPQTKYYQQYKANCITPREEIERIFHDPTYPKEFRIGVTGADDHSSAIPSEILESNAIGTVKYQELQTDGSILGKVRIDLAKADRVLGPNNWIRENTKANQRIPMSVARWTVDRPQGNDRLETNLDIRSYVATRYPRNEEIGVK